MFKYETFNMISQLVWGFVSRLGEFFFSPIVPEWAVQGIDDTLAINLIGDFSLLDFLGIQSISEVTVLWSMFIGFGAYITVTFIGWLARTFWPF